jgi:hypothetical protein
LPGGRRNLRATTESPAVAAQRMKAAAEARRAAIESPDATSAAGSTTHQEERTSMPFDLAKLKDALGLPAEPSPMDTALTAFGSALSQSGEDGATPPLSTPADSGGLVLPPTVNAQASEAGAVLLDPDTLRQLQESARKGETAWAQMKRNERDGVIKDAINKGKFPPAREEYWKQLWDRDPDGTRQAIDQLACNVVPILSAGYLGDDSAQRSAAMQAYEGLFGREEN